mmetsp:Transcript_126419/g.363637  ORF Transcript_126419/g.363637 Transcript_126419/m.363637 type:complete len:180 (+) Transcript_126419:77-616(+)
MAIPAKKSGGTPAKARQPAKRQRRESKIARGRLARALVLRGKKEKTVGGLTQDALMRNKRGRIVSKRRSALGRRRYSLIEPWVESMLAARKVLRLVGFVPINGKSLQGKALYAKCHEVLRNRPSGSAACDAAAAAPAVAGGAAADVAEAAADPVEVSAAPAPAGAEVVAQEDGQHGHSE